MASLAALSLRMARVRLGPSIACPWNGAAASLPKALTMKQQVRFKTNKKKQKIARRAQSAIGSKRESESTQEPPSTEQLVSSPHDDWVKFQQSIAVDGFETGQIVQGVSGQKRGGKLVRKRRERQMAALQERDTRSSVGGGGQFPAMRYSDEETERLLAEAYANKPVKGGSKKTRHLKREYRRWFLVRKARAKQKRFLIQAHFRKMEKRSIQVKGVLAAKAEAPASRDRDAAYRKEVLRKWAVTMIEGQGDGERVI